MQQMIGSSPLIDLSDFLIFRTILFVQVYYYLFIISKSLSIVCVETNSIQINNFKFGLLDI